MDRIYQQKFLDQEKKWEHKIKILKENNCQQGILCPVKLSFTERQRLPNK